MQPASYHRESRVRTSRSGGEDSIILSCPLSSPVLMYHTSGLMRTTDELANARGGAVRVCLYFFPDQPFTFQAIIQIG